MTISILSQAAVSPKGLAAQSSAAAGEDIAVGNTLFAGLLGQQLSQLTALSAAAPSAGTEGESAASGKKSAKKSVLPEELVPAGQIVALQPVQAAVTSELRLNTEPEVASVAPGDEVQEGLLAGLVSDKPLAAEAQKLPVDGAAFGQFLPVQAAASGATQPPAEAGQAKVLPLPISDSNWSKAMSEQMLSLVSVKADKAQIQINPPELGPIDVTLKLNQDQVQVTFSVATPQAREAVENSLPKLATMLAGSGLQLADAQVSSGQSGGDPRQSQRQAKASREPEDQAVEGSDTLSLINRSRNVLSIFA
ncbi:flagellar hook-length control protein FliK [Pseudogulbenkiania sp. MAI-1]|uniref:flagellar hook-length control protein FliK n=1 Tax=Pseudogulbenkiania sp. MAI-1 TaxID=990370 RepID=UPI0004B36B30|nr:flagellar hook-length control protein FliK [Pseudogulbenkiania sp. MAI-1]